MDFSKSQASNETLKNFVPSVEENLLDWMQLDSSRYRINLKQKFLPPHKFDPSLTLLLEAVHLITVKWAHKRMHHKH